MIEEMLLFGSAAALLVALWYGYSSLLCTIARRRFDQQAAAALGRPDDKPKAALRSEATADRGDRPEPTDEMALLRSIERLISSAGVKITSAQLLAWAGLLALVAGALSALAAGLIFFPLGAAFGAWFPFWHICRKRRKRLSLLPAQLEQACHLMIMAMESGAQLPAAIRSASEEVDDPLGAELRRLYSRWYMGEEFGLLLQDFSRSVPLAEARPFIAALMLAREKGGNPRALMEKVAAAIDGRRQLVADAEVEAEQGRYAAIFLSLLPLGAALLLLIINRSYLEVLFVDPVGRVLITIAAALQITGALLARRVSGIARDP